MGNDVLREAVARIRRFERLGGVDLRRLEPEARHDLLAEVRSGIAPVKRGSFRFRCPLCANEARNDQEMEPMCTGPTWQDSHPPEVMVLIARPLLLAPLPGQR